MADDKDELLPIVDENGRVVEAKTREACHNGSRLLHPVVHLHVFNSRGEIFLQKRPEWKDIQPGRWDTACGGHVSYGESAEQALKREVNEELGIDDYYPTEVAHYVYDSVRERELVYVNITIYDLPLHPSKEELSDGRFWTIEEVKGEMGKGVFTPNFESELVSIVLPALKEAILIRQGLPEDAPTIAGLMMTAWGDGICDYLQGENHNREDLHELLTMICRRENTQYSYRNALLAQVDGTTVGLALSYDGGRLVELRWPTIVALKEIFHREISLVDETQAGELYLDALGVSPNFRCRGIGSALLRSTQRKAERLGLPVGLLVDIENEQARRVYLKNSFQELEDRLVGPFEMRHMTLQCGEKSRASLQHMEENPQPRPLHPDDR